MFRDIVTFIDNIIWVPILALLLFTGIYFTFQLKFVQLRLLPESIRMLFSNENSKDDKHRINPIEAFLIGLASRIGAGNIAGVSLAVMTGGPGSLFWMWLVSFIVASSSFVENTLGQIYKEKEEDKGYVGGPAYYMNKGLNARKAGILFSILLVLCYAFAFSSIQANTISSILQNTFNSDNLMTGGIIGIILMILVGLVLLFGAKGIAKISSLMVPIMAIGYVGLAIIVIVFNIEKLGSVMSLIFTGAFTPQAVGGATLGSVIMIGARRGMLSNEAGMGSAPNAAATATTSHPVKQGLIQMIGVFIDTWIVCTATGMIILLSLSQEELYKMASAGTDGIVLVQTSLVNSLGQWSGILLVVFVFFFSFTSILGNYYYSESAYEYLFGTKGIIPYKLAVVFIVFIGSVVESKVLWDISDILMGMLAFVNLISIFLLFRYSKSALKDYLSQMKEKKDPVFLAKNIEGLEGTVWTEENALEFKELD